MQPSTSASATLLTEIQPQEETVLAQTATWQDVGDGDNEARLLRQARSGSREAFDRLIRQYERPLRGYLSRRLPVSIIEDVLQDTWIAAWCGVSRISRGRRFKAWLFAIAAHKCADHYRAMGRRPFEAPLEDADRMGRAGGQANDPFEAIEWRHYAARALACVPADQRDVLELYYLAELTLAEVAQALDRNLNTIKSQFYRAHTVAAASLNGLDAAEAEHSGRTAVSDSQHWSASEQALLLYAHGALHPPARYVVERHLRGCPACQGRLARLGAASRALASAVRGDGLPSRTASSQLGEAGFAARLRLVLLALAVVLLATLMVQVGLLIAGRSLRSDAPSAAASAGCLPGLPNDHCR